MRVFMGRMKRDSTPAVARDPAHAAQRLFFLSSTPPPAPPLRAGGTEADGRGTALRADASEFGGAKRCGASR